MMKMLFVAGDGISSNSIDGGPVAFHYDTAYSRNRGLITVSEQTTLRNATIAIPGMGGVGGIHLATLARLGVGGFHIADADTFSLSNFNRQYGASVSTHGKDKTQIMAAIARDINPDVRLKMWDEFINESNIEEFLSGCDLVFDSLDAFEMASHRLLFRKAREMGIPLISAGPIGFSCSMVIFGKDGMDAERYFGFADGQTREEQFAHFIVGVAPRLHFIPYLQPNEIDDDERKGPSVASAVTLCAGFAATEAVKILLRRGKVYYAPYYHCYDAYRGLFRRGRTLFGHRNPFHQIKIKMFVRWLRSGAK